MSTDGATRRQIKPKILRLYFGESKKYMEKSGGKISFDFDDLCRTYRFHFVNQAALLMQFTEVHRGSLPKCKTEQEKVFLAQLGQLRLMALHAVDDMMEIWDDLNMENLL
ncbi:hypothetical protein L596_014783 [Steinernema carpocapsae]|uniref:Uncharacterized protein n=1 Tax=Steinernema carpocapsae TaxID=34508 RepID=A0A4U5NCX2_STECR|nr:hypothetical protein L596_014783 [Steinernema carpocapsae]